MTDQPVEQAVPQAGPKPVVIISIDEQGRISWQSKLPPANMLLALEEIKLQILMGQVKQHSDTPIVKPNGIDGLMARMRKR